jgi:GDP-4-dehydro-6-deoxy-D-mannose reductase
MRAFITGITGFVGKYLSDFLQSQEIEVYGTTSLESKSNINNNVIYNNLSNENELINLLERIKPDMIFHLAGQSNVKDSWENKTITISVNVNSTVNLLEAARKSSLSNHVKILTVGSSEEYGKVNEIDIPTTEKVALQPTNPYGISKAAVSFFAKQYFNAYGLKVLHVRPFNHIGPGQRPGFVVSDFSSQIIRIERGEQERVMYVGNLGAQRDFTDVRDIVRAYYLLLQSDKMHYGEVFNVCSGTPIAISSILNKLLLLSNRQIELKTDHSKMRATDVPKYIGDNTKLKQMTGWTPTISLESTLSDVLEHLRKQQGGSQNAE